MTLRASGNKINPTLGLLRTTLNKNIGSIVLLSVAMLIFCPGLLLAVLSQTRFDPADYSTPDALNSVYGVTVALSCIFVCIANYVNFSYLYKKSSSDVFGALPLTRTGLLFARAAAGFIGILIPVTIGYIALAFLNIPYPAYAIGTIPQICSAYLMNILLMLAFSGFSLIFIVCAGSGFDLALSFGGFNIAVLATGAIIHGLCSSYLSGYSEEFTGFLRVLSPIYYLVERSVLFADGNYTLKGAGDIVFGIVKYALAFFIAAPLLYRFRKAERGEQAYAYKFIYVICSVLAGICGGYALSEMFVFAADKAEYSAIGFLAFAAGAIITSVVYGAVTDRGFKGFRQSMAIGGVSVVIYGVVAAVILSGAFGFEKRLPAQNDITEATVVFEDVDVTFKNPEYALALHKAIIEKGADEEYRDDVVDPHTTVQITYKLDGNKEMLREYFIKLSTLKRELFSIYSSDERFEKMGKTINETKTGKLNIWGDYATGKEDEFLDVSGTVTKAEAENIIAVYRKELNELGEDVFDEKSQKNKVADIRIEIQIDNYYDDVSIYTTDKFEKTNEIIRGFTEVA